MFKLLSDWSSKRRVIRELSQLSDRSLADLGIARLDIKAVADASLMMTPDEVASVVAPRAGRSRIAQDETMSPAWGPAQRPTSLAA